MDENITPSEAPLSLAKNENKILDRALIGSGILILFYLLFLSPPRDFPTGKIFRVGSGSSLHAISTQLKREHYIRSSTAFETAVIILGREKRVIATDYYFEKRIAVYTVAKRMVKGEHNLAPISVTIPEGFNADQIADTFSLKLSRFNKENFLLEARRKEGYLFPDTYFFSTTDTEKEVLALINSNFTKKITPILPEITASGKKENDIIIMASLVEREAKGEDDRGVIAGILWKRISIGMPLQVDAAPETYKTRGLPQNPIANPGLAAIKAAIHPVKSPFLYYLHDKDGNIHYARDFKEHTQNKLKYLK